MLSHLNTKPHTDIIHVNNNTQWPFCTWIQIIRGGVIKIWGNVPICPPPPRMTKTFYVLERGLLTCGSGAKETSVWPEFYCEKTSVTEIGLIIDVSMTQTDVYSQSDSGHWRLLTAKFWPLTFNYTLIYYSHTHICLASLLHARSPLFLNGEHIDGGWTPGRHLSRHICNEKG